MKEGSAPEAHANAAGSPLPGEPVFLAVGKLRHAHGVRGAMFVEVLTDFPERLQPGTVLFLGNDAGQLHLTSCRRHQDGLIMTFEGFTTPEQVSSLRNQVVYVSSADRPPLGDGEYYHHQLVNMDVVTSEGVSLGKVAEILETGATDVLVVHSDSRAEVLIPMAKAFIEEVDLDRQVIRVHLIPGMLGEES